MNCCSHVSNISYVITVEFFELNLWSREEKTLRDEPYFSWKWGYAILGVWITFFGQLCNSLCNFFLSQTRDRCNFSFSLFFLLHIILYIYSYVCVSVCVVWCVADHIMHSQLVNCQSGIFNPVVISDCQYTCYDYHSQLHFINFVRRRLNKGSWSCYRTW